MFTNKLMCFTVATCVLAVAAMPSDPYAPKEEKKPYEFSYGVQDEYKNTNFQQSESSDGAVVQGVYVVDLPDGRQQVVKYQSDHQQGYIAEVTYKGEAQYPPKSDKKPFTAFKKQTYEPSYEPEYPQTSYEAPQYIENAYEPQYNPQYKSAESQLSVDEEPAVYVRPEDV